MMIKSADPKLVTHPRDFNGGLGNSNMSSSFAVFFGSASRTFLHGMGTGPLQDVA